MNAVAIEFLKELSPEDKRRLLRELMLRRSQQIEAEHPTASGQRALWFLQQRNPGSVAYNMMLAGRIRGPIRIDALRAAWRDVCARHAALRTTYPLRAGAVIQVIARDAAPLAEHDVSTLDDDALRARVEDDAHRPIDLTAGPVALARLYTRAPDDHVLSLVVHHIATDATSMQLLLDELREFYLARAADRPPPPELSAAGASYVVYSEWEQALLSGPDGERLWRYWQEALAGDVPPLTLPPTRMPGDTTPPPAPRPAFQTFDGEEFIVRLDDDVAAQARAFARSRRVTLYTLVLGGLFALLRRYTGQSDLCVGAFVSHRPRPELERALGYYINTLPLRARVPATLSFGELLEQVGRTTLDALDHKDFPFAALVERLNPRRDPGRSPLFDIALNQWSGRQFESFTGVSLGLAPDAAPHAEPPWLTPYPLRRRFARFDLELAVAESDAAIALYTVFNTAVLDRPTVELFTKHLQQFLRGALQRPDAPLSEHDLLTPQERRHLLAPHPSASAPPTGCLHHRFEAQARRTPDAIAVRAGGRTFTYRELDARADRIAAELRRRGVGPEVPVVVCVERSEHMLPALLGVLKAGGAYVPVDPAYPPERIRTMIEDSGAALVLTTVATAATCRELAATVLRVDALPESSDRPAEPAPVGPGHLAYIIYTSGSTGRPKGVEVRHGGCEALFAWADAAFPPGDFAATLASTSICFDVSVFELFYPLGIGGSLILVDTPLHLVDLAPELAVTSIITVPSAIGALVDLPTFPASVRAAYLAGEPLRRGLVARIRERTAIERVYNIYGPTENTVYSTWTEVPRDLAGEPTIGRPLPGCRAYVLDESQQPVPLLHVGELYLGGVGVARGYHDRPELTAERFLPDPFADDPDARMYRTGDLARLRPDGEIELLGRRDLQIKLHGYRIELGEIEAALSRHPGLREAAVRVQERRGERRLVGYLSPTSEALHDARSLCESVQRHLERSLPAYMVPPVLLAVPELPHLPNGKIDRARLPDPDEPAAATAATSRPHGPTAQRVAEVWADLLRVPVAEIGLHDSFYALGGHSLLLAQMAQSLSVRFERRVTIAELFRLRDVAAIAAWLDAAGNDDGAAVQSAEDRAQQRRKQLAHLRRGRTT